MAGRGTHLLHLLRYRASRPVLGHGVRAGVGETVEGYGGLLGHLADTPDGGGEAGLSGPTFDGLVACRGHPESASVASLRLFTINRKAVHVRRNTRYGCRKRGFPPVATLPPCQAAVDHSRGAGPALRAPSRRGSARIQSSGTTKPASAPALAGPKSLKSLSHQSTQRSPSPQLRSARMPRFRSVRGESGSCTSSLICFRRLLDRGWSGSMGNAAWMARSDSMVGMNPNVEILHTKFPARQPPLGGRTKV